MPKYTMQRCFSFVARRAAVGQDQLHGATDGSSAKQLQFRLSLNGANALPENGNENVASDACRRDTRIFLEHEILVTRCSSEI